MVMDHNEGTGERTLTSWLIQWNFQLELTSENESKQIATLLASQVNLGHSKRLQMQLGELTLLRNFFYTYNKKIFDCI